MDEVLSESSPNTNEDSPELSFSVLNACSEEQKSKFRLCERNLLKITCISSHLSFNETCVNNNLLPTYTNVNVHNEAARRDAITLDYRLKLIEREIREQKKELYDLKVTYNEHLKELEQITSEADFLALKMIIQRSQNKKFLELRVKQSSKLVGLYGAPILMKQNRVCC